MQGQGWDSGDYTTVLLSQTLDKTELTDEQEDKVIRNGVARAFLGSQTQGSSHSLSSEK